MALKKLFVSALVICFIILAEGKLTEHFRGWLDENYGRDTGAKLERSEKYQLPGGSFGGRKDDDDVIKNQPVIFIHGTTLSAQSFLPHRKYFLERGYTEAELYATTYGDAGRTPFFSKPMYCEDVQQVREFITAVHEYTNSPVDILAYSMGVAITRKAMMGGRCVDTGDDLGGPITHIVDTYVGVAGVAYGLERCPDTTKACNPVNGMICSSEYIADVNSNLERYEGTTSYAIYSTDDFLVGQNCCGHQCSELKNANQTVIRQRYDHITLFTMTKDIQYDLIRDKSVDIRKLRFFTNRFQSINEPLPEMSTGRKYLLQTNGLALAQKAQEKVEKTTKHPT
ncbi:lipase (class 2) domain-containing protein [Ditylenchus destructor]|nr:lipase (class 2) domain-containing protein [Ditylenchus destructor]